MKHPRPIDWLHALDLPGRWHRAEAFFQRWLHHTGPPSFVPGAHGEGEGQRDYKLFVPSGASGAGRPLVVMLHGCTQNPDDFARGTRMNELAREHGFLVLYPAQSERANAHKCWNWFEPGDQQRGRGEPALLAGMVRQVIAEHAVDARRVYVAGLSAGGAMAVLLGREYPELFAAVGVHSGLAGGVARGVVSALHVMKHGPSMRRVSQGPMPPTIAFHGEHDAVVHPANGQQVVGDALGGMLDGAAPSIVIGHAGRSYTHTTHHDASGQVLAEHWLVHGLGHAWSGGDVTGSYADAAGPDASREMLRFFLAHPRAV